MPAARRWTLCRPLARHQPQRQLERWRPPPRMPSAPPPPLPLPWPATAPRGCGCPHLPPLLRSRWRCRLGRSGGRGPEATALAGSRALPSAPVKASRLTACARAHSPGGRNNLDALLHRRPPREPNLRDAARAWGPQTHWLSKRSVHGTFCSLSGSGSSNLRFQRLGWTLRCPPGVPCWATWSSAERRPSCHRASCWLVPFLTGASNP
mmetsp:Transcript_139025/g.387786  ORF Transcript_139025/g.387786 Transcript_139025/m.387786 type:complete len:208 (+) Transcript_139025:542-1165(+)